MISKLENKIALRYLRTRKKDGFLNVISTFSFIGISLGVAVLIIVMSVMNGFRSELISKIVGFNSHIIVHSYGKVTKDFFGNDYWEPIELAEGQLEEEIEFKYAKGRASGLSTIDINKVNVINLEKANTYGEPACMRLVSEDEIGINIEPVPSAN